MSYFAGIDFSTHAVDVVFVDEEDFALASWTRFELEGEDAFDRARSIGRHPALFASVLWDNVIAAAIEEPFARDPKTRQLVPKLKMVQGAVVAGLPASLLVQPLSPSEWRAGVDLAGNASKDDVRLWAQTELGHLIAGDRFPLTAWAQDGYDAYALARAVSKLVQVAA